MRFRLSSQTSKSIPKRKVQWSAGPFVQRHGGQDGGAALPRNPFGVRSISGIASLLKSDVL
jgi:hypothetical protein